VEGTAIGNIMLQAKAAGLVETIGEMRQFIAKSIETQEYLPQDAELWDKGYEKYLSIYREDI
jgi:rhamnulokinase